MRGGATHCRLKPLAECLTEVKTHDMSRFNQEGRLDTYPKATYREQSNETRL